MTNLGTSVDAKVYFDMYESSYKIREFRIWNLNPGNGAKDINIGYAHSSTSWSEPYSLSLPDQNGIAGNAEPIIVPIHFNLNYHPRYS